MKRQANMASKTSKADPVTLEDFGRDVARRRGALGDTADLPRNSGNRRTASKRALLKAIAAAGGRW